MITVAGGGGLLGRRVVADLVAAGERVRVLVRDAGRARDMSSESVEIVSADVRRREGLSEAVLGADVVVSAVHGFLGGKGAGPAEVDERGNTNLIDAAVQTGSEVILVSVSGAAPGHPVDLFRAKYAAEEYLRHSGAVWTIVRAPAYLETWLGILSETAGDSGRPLIFGRGDRPIPFVSASDVADVVSGAVRDRAARGMLLEVAGEPITLMELAHALQATRGWHGEPRHVPRPVLRALALVARPVSPAFARQNRAAIAMDTGTPAAAAEGRTITPNPRRTLAGVVGGVRGVTSW